MKKILFCAALFIAASLNLLAGDSKSEIKPGHTFRFAQRDTCDLYLDIYDAAPGSETSYNGLPKPTIVFIFGGGFVSGSRNEATYGNWYRRFTETGHRVVAIDYRLGLKGMKNPGLNPQFIKTVQNAIEIAVEDLYSATSWLIENGWEYGIDPCNLVLCGSSAGAITAMQAEWELCNRSERAGILPREFNYAGVISLSGAIFSPKGALQYDREPCPTFMLHGTKDKIVKYKQIALFDLRFMGSSVISRTFKDKSYNYRIMRFSGNGHEIAVSLLENYPHILDFIQENVMNGICKTVDATVSDPRIEKKNWGSGNYKKLYK